jgi:hypothetical protein
MFLTSDFRKRTGPHPRGEGLVFWHALGGGSGGGILGCGEKIGLIGGGHARDKSKQGRSGDGTQSVLRGLT